MLVHVAQLMKSSIRASDWLGRYGGEEFLVIASESPGNDAIRLAERLRLAVADNPFIFDGLAISATISLGIVNTLSLESPTPEALVNIADSALYRAKDNGRNRIEVEPHFLAESLKPERDEGSSLNSVAH